MNELDAAAVFLQVVSSEGYTNAARVLGRSASTLSRTITELEAHLGASLLARTTRTLRLTEAGALYQVHAERLLAARQAARDALAELQGAAPRGHLRVSMPVSVGERLLARHLPAFRARYPELRLDIDLSDHNVSLVRDGFDLTIRVGRPADSALRALLLGRIPVLLVASPAYLRARGVPRSPRDLVRHECLVVSPRGGPQEWTFFRGARRARHERVVVKGGVQTTSPTLATQLAIAGEGILRLPAWLVKDEIERGDLVRVMVPWSCDDPRHKGFPVYVMYAQAGSAVPPRKSRVFVDMVKAIMAAEVARSG